MLRVPRESRQGVYRGKVGLTGLRGCVRAQVSGSSLETGIPIIPNVAAFPSGRNNASSVSNLVLPEYLFVPFKVGTRDAASKYTDILLQNTPKRPHRSKKKKKILRAMVLRCKSCQVLRIKVVCVSSGGIYCVGRWVYGDL